MTSLNVEPGGKSSSFARETSGLSGSAFSRFQAGRTSLGSCDESSFGSNVGFDAIARTSPVEGSMATMAPPCGIPETRVAASRWSPGSIVVTTLDPRFGRPSTRSEIV